MGIPRSVSPGGEPGNLEPVVKPTTAVGNIVQKGGKLISPKPPAGPPPTDILVKAYTKVLQELKSLNPALPEFADKAAKLQENIQKHKEALGTDFTKLEEDLNALFEPELNEEEELAKLDVGIRQLKAEEQIIDVLHPHLDLELDERDAMAGLKASMQKLDEATPEPEENTRVPDQVATPMKLEAPKPTEAEFEKALKNFCASRTITKEEFTAFQRKYDEFSGLLDEACKSIFEEELNSAKGDLERLQNLQKKIPIVFRGTTQIYLGKNIENAIGAIKSPEKKSVTVLDRIKTTFNILLFGPTSPGGKHLKPSRMKMLLLTWKSLWTSVAPSTKKYPEPLKIEVTDIGVKTKELAESYWEGEINAEEVQKKQKEMAEALTSNSISPQSASETKLSPTKKKDLFEKNLNTVTTSFNTAIYKIIPEITKELAESYWNGDIDANELQTRQVEMAEALTLKSIELESAFGAQLKATQKDILKSGNLLYVMSSCKKNMDNIVLENLRGGNPDKEKLRGLGMDLKALGLE